MVARIALALALALPISAWSQSFNGTFEALQPNGVPMGWSLADPGGSAVTSDAHLGKRAAKAWVHDAYRPGVWISNSSAADGNAAQVTGYYKYVGDKKRCEKATVSYILGAKGAEGGIDTMAYGITELKLEKSYTKFSLNVSAMGTGTPDFVSIQMSPKGHCDVHGEENCCFLYVDDIILAGTTTLEEAPILQEVIEEVIDSVQNAPEIDEPEPTPPPAEEAAPEPKVEETPAAPVENENPNPEATPEEEEPAPAEDEETTEPVEEGWDKGEESLDGGNR
jgi:hypothetical protein